ncbi:hypothetical protein BCR32DRAFT_286825 [Anaeromyces robustus]|uniref:Uncharacterized protein n=1 Tax=Anaeromyces robustus TaxID=1754192 RepID=A0A1Y1VU69_9FUNG|nr:hypothetical protein BCR32DRAFT_286825 [Anaeromyces robustus]|eukprot:ORX64849.1 hypothetical protein BCR32DRAFT_286825 [Anaeromyces robustus]
MDNVDFDELIKLTYAISAISISEHFKAKYDINIDPKKIAKRGSNISYKTNIYGSELLSSNSCIAIKNNKSSCNKKTYEDHIYCKIHLINEGVNLLEHMNLVNKSLYDNSKIIPKIINLESYWYDNINDNNNNNWPDIIAKSSDVMNGYILCLDNKYGIFIISHLKVAKNKIAYLLATHFVTINEKTDTYEFSFLSIKMLNENIKEHKNALDLLNTFKISIKPEEQESIDSSNYVLKLLNNKLSKTSNKMIIQKMYINNN